MGGGGDVINSRSLGWGRRELGPHMHPLSSDFPAPNTSPTLSSSAVTSPLKVWSKGGCDLTVVLENTR